MKITPPDTPKPLTEVRPAASRPPAAPADVGTALLARFKPGQTLTATVAGANSGGSLPLTIDGKLLEVSSSLQLMEGMALKLRLEKGAGGELSLRVLEPVSQKAVEQQLLQQALRRALPQQGELKPMLEALARLATSTPPAATPATSPAAPQVPSAPNPAPQSADLGQLLHRAALRLMQSLPEPRQLSQPQGLKQALADSGLLFEHKLAQGDPQALERDLKGQLLRLLAQLTRASRIPPPIATSTRAPAQAPQANTPSPPAPQPATQGGKPAPPTPSQAGARVASAEQLLGLIQGLSRQGESALSRIQLNQLHSLPRAEADSPEWLLELPVRHAQNQLETVKLRIRRDGGGKGGEQGAEQWQISLVLEDGRGGPLQVRMGLSRERVSVDFRAEDAGVAEALGEKLGELERRLRARGLDISRLASHQGLAEIEPPPRGDGLLREEV